ncbi:hypothetical protein HYW75_03710 [Candidatus Pacearchaeota archaeon]|nr:hypothetical protein [Candidatus Pacearchaeota archaeon]
MEEKYHKKIREDVIPFLERISPDMWIRQWEDIFTTGITNFSGWLRLPLGTYRIILVKTGELTFKRLCEDYESFTVFDNEVKAIYSKLEQFEKA